MKLERNEAPLFAAAERDDEDDQAEGGRGRAEHEEPHRRSFGQAWDERERGSVDSSGREEQGHNRQRGSHGDEKYGDDSAPDHVPTLQKKSASLKAGG
jgi:hypothetical protein